MLALIDIGNTRTKYCIVDEGKRSSQYAVLNSDMTNWFLTQNFIGIKKIIVGSVSHDKLTDKLSSWCTKNEVDYQQIISEKQKNNVVSGYQEPSKLGVDRWLALIGAERMFPNQNILIIDAGTATTIDLLAYNGHHQGGWILAGVNILISSVLTQTSRVTADDTQNQSLSFGRNTSENVHNAAWAATVGTIDFAILQAKTEGYTLLKIIITGGNGKLLSTLISHKHTLIEDLVFDGIEAYL